MPQEKAEKKNRKSSARDVLWEERSSGIHGRGIFAAAKIKKGARIIEYVGEKITKKEAVRRAARQITRNRKNVEEGAVYIFEINSRYDIDGNVDWNPARFINHSCDPNCETLNDNGHIWIEAIRKIKPGEELTYNYGYDVENYQDHPCRCGSKKCVGYIVRKSQWKKLAKQIKKARKKKN
jgi:SET domain-containing protein